jgi:hypothetical protein
VKIAGAIVALSPGADQRTHGRSGLLTGGIPVLEI